MTNAIQLESTIWINSKEMSENPTNRDQDMCDVHVQYLRDLVQGVI